MHNRRDDRLSSLPDELIHKIFSFISIKDAVRTCVLSSSWRSIWTSMPYLNFENLKHGPSIFKFISNVLSHLDNKTHVFSVNLVLGKSVRDDESVRKVLNYAFSHNVQQLSVGHCVTRLRGGKMVKLPFSFSCIPTPTWDPDLPLPALTTLHFHNVKLSRYIDIGLFSKCTNLKNLFLTGCIMEITKVLNICHPRLSNLTLENTPLDMSFDEVVNVVAPQLKNLTIRWCEGKHLISAPELTSLVIEGSQPWQVSTPSGFHSLEKAELFMYDPFKADIHRIVSLLQQLRSVKLLKLNLGILQRLFSETCVLSNAKILKFMPNILLDVWLEIQSQEKVSTNHDTCLSMVTREDITAMGDIRSAQVFVVDFTRLLRQCKVNTKRDKDTRIDEPQVEMFWAGELQWNFWRLMELLQDGKIVKLETCHMMSRIRVRYSNGGEIRYHMSHDCMDEGNEGIV
ncbi:unnamed protein product [Lactuca virosa]|uniref:F-box domain-containing protein n=1 Tax=Lactuca virosa TaxID=75947 RepID=A0AAU9LHF5_9ASTR|nr:unnamed protein product [Lactuca virosa]